MISFIQAHPEVFGIKTSTYESGGWKHGRGVKNYTVQERLHSRLSQQGEEAGAHSELNPVETKGGRKT